MNREQALQKIAKCLALAKSANEHEAAAAMRQAQALMAAHALESADVELASVAEHPSRARSTVINLWENALAHLVGEAFGCQHFSHQRQRYIGTRFRPTRDVVFVGIGPAAEVASYAFDVLLRQCTAARAEHVKKQPSSCKPITKTGRGDRFAVAWVCAVRGLVSRFAGQAGDQALIEAYIGKKYPQLQSVKPKDKAVGRNVRDMDADAGYTQGAKARLEHGLGASAQPLALPNTGCGP